jgi:GNAT superfamily N-acetyltransferase
LPVPIPDLSDLALRWQRGWAAARTLPPARDLGDALRTHCLQPGRDVEYVALHADDDPPSLRRLAERVLGEKPVTWLTVPTLAPDRAANALLAAGLVLLRRAERLMTTDLREHPRHAPAPGYAFQRHARDGAITVSLHHESGDLAASGTMGLSLPDATADRITTVPAHRRQGLASAVMTALAETALDAGAHNGFLIASEAGQGLYTSLGWHPVADVLIAAPPGTVYPT